MDVPISGDCDLQRLREALQRVGGRSNEEKIENSECENSKRTERVSHSDMEKLGLDDVGLLDLSENRLEDEDSWLYESPKRQATPAQKSVSPYKYLHQNIDISDLNKVRGSLMAKLESIAAQEEYLSKPTTSTASSGTPSSFHENIDDGDDDNDFEIRGCIRRRGGTFTKPMQPNGTYISPHAQPRGNIRPRGTGVIQRGQPNGSDSRDDFDAGFVVRPQNGVKPRRAQYAGDINDNNMNSDLLVRPRGTVRPRGAAVQPRGQQNFDNSDDVDDFDENDMNTDFVVRPRGGVKPRGSGAHPQGQEYDDDNEMNSDLVVRPRGGIKPRGKGSHPQGQQYDDNNGMNSDLVVKPRGGVKPRGSGAQPQGQQYDDDNELNSDLVVKPRGGVKPRGSGAQPQCQQYDDEEDMNSDLVVKPRGGVKPRGSGAQPRGQLQNAGSDDLEESGLVVKPRSGVKTRTSPVDTGRWDIPAAAEEEADPNLVVRPRGNVTSRGSGGPKPRVRPSQQNSFDDNSDDDECMGPVRRRTFKMPQRTEPKTDSPRVAWQVGGGNEDEREVNLATPRRRGEQQLDVVDVELEDDLDNDSAPVVRRRGGTPVSTNSTVPVKRRAGTPTGTPRTLTPPSSGLPAPVRSRLQAPENDVKRRSLPQAPTPRGTGQIKPRTSYSDNALESRVTGSASPHGRRSMSPARFGTRSESPVVPRGSKLAAPRRIPAPRGTSPSEESWKEGCF